MPQDSIIQKIVDGVSVNVDETTGLSCPKPSWCATPVPAPAEDVRVGTDQNCSYDSLKTAR